MTTVRQVYVLLFRKYCDLKELNLLKIGFCLEYTLTENYFASKVVVKVNYICQATEIDCGTLHYFRHLVVVRERLNIHIK